MNSVLPEPQHPTGPIDVQKRALVDHLRVHRRPNPSPHVLTLGLAHPATTKALHRRCGFFNCASNRAATRLALESGGSRWSSRGRADVVTKKGTAATG